MNISAIARGERSDDACIYGKPIPEFDLASGNGNVARFSGPEPIAPDGCSIGDKQATRIHFYIAGISWIQMRLRLARPDS